MGQLPQMPAPRRAGDSVWAALPPVNRQAALYWLVALVGRTLPAETTPAAGDLAVPRDEGPAS